jgi:transcriptional regulator with XRE-family HTH domain
MGNKRPRPARLSAKLLAIRRHLGLSQIKMVMRLKTEDLSYHRISEYESGRREPNIMVLLRYARAADVPVECLIDDEMELPFVSSENDTCPKTA